MKKIIIACIAILCTTASFASSTPGMINVSFPDTKIVKKKIPKSFVDTSMEQILWDIDIQALKGFANSNDSIACDSLLQPFADRIVTYVSNVYNEDISTDNDTFACGTVLLGMLIYAHEKGYTIDSSGTENRMIDDSDPFGCLWAALGALTSITTIIDLYNDIQNGATLGSITKKLLKVLRRFSGAVAVGMAIFAFIACMD